MGAAQYQLPARLPATPGRTCLDLDSPIALTKSKKSLLRCADIIEAIFVGCAAVLRLSELALGSCARCASRARCSCPRNASIQRARPLVTWVAQAESYYTRSATLACA